MAKRYWSDAQKIEYFLERAAHQTFDTCDLWEGGRDRNGYGRVWFNKRWLMVHRVIWETVRGPIASGLVLNHWLRDWDPTSCSILCCNLEHLDPTTDADNILSGHGACAENKRKTHCAGHGHSLTGANVYLHPDGRRECRACKRASNRAYHERKLERQRFAWRTTQ